VSEGINVPGRAGKKKQNALTMILTLKELYPILCHDLHMGWLLELFTITFLFIYM